MAMIDCPRCGQKKDENTECKICALITSAVAAARSPPTLKFDLPQFSTDQLGGIQTWIKQVEIRLNLMKLQTEDQKYDFIAAGLPTKIINRVYDLIRTKPDKDPYTTLKNKIIKEFEPSEDQQIQQLLEGMKIGDKKPSAFLREMRSLGKDRVQDSVLRQMLINQLPPITAGVLNLSKTLTLDQLADAADEGWSREKRGEVNEVSKTIEPPPANEDMVSYMIEALERLGFSNNRGRSRNRTPNPRNRSQSQRRTNNDGLCWAHRKFGEEARTCRHWCRKYKKQGNIKNSQ